MLQAAGEERRADRRVGCTARMSKQLAEEEEVAAVHTARTRPCPASCTAHTDRALLAVVAGRRVRSRCCTGRGTGRVHTGRETAHKQTVQVAAAVVAGLLEDRGAGTADKGCTRLAGPGIAQPWLASPAGGRDGRQQRCLDCTTLTDGTQLWAHQQAKSDRRARLTVAAASRHTRPRERANCTARGHTAKAHSFFERRLAETHSNFALLCTNLPFVLRPPSSALACRSSEPAPLLTSLALHRLSTLSNSPAPRLQPPCLGVRARRLCSVFALAVLHSSTAFALLQPTAMQSRLSRLDHTLR